jgi:hypothetical protein
MLLELLIILTKYFLSLQSFNSGESWILHTNIPRLFQNPYLLTANVRYETDRLE